MIPIAFNHSIDWKHNILFFSTNILSKEDFSRKGFEIPFPQLLIFNKPGKVEGLLRSSFSFPPHFFYVAFISVKEVLERASKENRRYQFLISASHKTCHFALPIFFSFPNEEGVITYIEVQKRNINKVKKQDGLHYFKFYLKGSMEYKVGGEKDFDDMLDNFIKVLDEDSKLFFSLVNFMGTRR